MGFKIFLIWVFVMIGRPQDIFPWLNPLRPALVLGFVNLIFVFFNHSDPENLSLLKFKEAKMYLLFYMIMMLGIPFAYHRRVAFEFVFLSYIMNVLFFFIFIRVVNSFSKLKSVIFTVCLSALFYCFYIFKMGSSVSGRLYAGSMFDPNDLAYMLVSFFPFFFFFLLKDSGKFKKTLAVTGIIASLILIPLTGSRGGLISLGVIIFLFLISKTQFKPLHKITFLIIILLVGALNFDKININRFETLSNIGSDYNATDEFGRVEIWKKAIQLTLTNPFVGVGVNCFPMALGQLREELHIIPMWQTVHNSYLLVAVETGIFGLIVFVLIIFGSLKNLSNCTKLHIKSYKITEFKSLAVLLQVAFIGHLVSAFFLSQSYSLLFTLFFALSVAMIRISFYIENSEDSALQFG